jgi:putative exosortase-associated protein (TIGR04073 family)
MMRRSHDWLVVAALALLVVFATGATAAVYDAPHYVTANAYYQAPGPMGGYNGYGAYGPCCDPLKPYEMCCKESPADKLTRGVVNFFTGWVEIPVNTVCGLMNPNVSPLDGVFSGFARGSGRAIERTGVGFYEAATFFMPGCGPLICPEYVSFNCECGHGYGCGCGYGGNYCQPQYQMCPPAPSCGCGCNPCQRMPQGCNPMFGGLQRPAPQQQQQNMGGYGAAQEQAPARSAGGAGGAAATYPDDYLK